MLQDIIETKPGLAPADTTLGAVHLSVTDGERALTVWRDLVGLTVLSRTPSEITLGVGGKPLIVLFPGVARPVVPRTSGLYHVAIHVPARADLARVLARLFTARFENSPTDHLVTETTYLWDPDGNGIEITFETPHRGKFVSDGQTYGAVTADGREHSGRDRLDVRSVLGELDPNENFNTPLPAGTRIGHVHVHVSDLDAAMGFYRDLIGFAEQFQARRIQMGDVTLPGYVPHIVAFNTWGTLGAPQAPAGSSGLRHFQIDYPDATALAAARARLEAAGIGVSDTESGLFTADPAGNRIRLTSRA
jgi:catechol 2,3-dioxygenase